MKKFVLRDEYVAISRDELKAFADEINNQGEAKRAKGADAEKARKMGKGVARSKIGKYLDNGKFEGRIYEREEALSREDLIKDDDDIRMMHHAGRFDGFNGGNGKSVKVVERKAKALKDINVDNVKSVQVDECISNGKWNGQFVSQEKYDEIMNEEGVVELMQRMFIKKIELMDDDGNRYEKIVRRVFEDYDAGALAKLLSKEYNGVNVNWGRKVKEVIYVGGLRKEILVRKALNSKLFVNGGFISERHDIDLKKGGVLVKGERGSKIKVDRKSKIVYVSKCRNDLGRYDYEKVMH